MLGLAWLGLARTCSLVRVSQQISLIWTSKGRCNSNSLLSCVIDDNGDNAMSTTMATMSRNFVSAVASAVAVAAFGVGLLTRLFICLLYYSTCFSFVFAWPQHSFGMPVRSSNAIPVLSSSGTSI